MTASSELVVVDTMLLSGLIARRRSELVQRYRAHLEGRALVVSFVTMAELRYGASVAGWGSPRWAAMEERLRRMVVVGADDELTTTCAQLRAGCRAVGHPLHEKVHEADRWIAATAVRHGLPLVSDDRVFVGTPGLALVREDGS